MKDEPKKLQSKNRSTSLLKFLLDKNYLIWVARHMNQAMLASGKESSGVIIGVDHKGLEVQSILFPVEKQFYFNTVSVFP